MRFLFIGDIVGKPGLQIVRSAVPRLRKEREIDVVIANAENVSGGSGCTPNHYKQLRDAGVDLITLGDHVYKKSEIISVLKEDDRICRPANFPVQSPGREFARTVISNDTSIAVVCVLGRTFMRPANCPFAAVDRVIAELEPKSKIIVVDIHAEATADKYLMARHLQGRVTAVLGTHTHVPTADEQILPGGTAFICDVGMTGPHDGILGRRADRVLTHAISFVPTSFDVSEGNNRLNGVIVECNAQTGRSESIQRIVVDEQ